MRRTFFLTFFAAFQVATASAQQTITYTNGENDASTISITPATNPTTLTIASGTATQSGVISDLYPPPFPSGSVVLNGGGTLIFTANNTYPGSTTISAGALQIGAGTASGSVAGSIVDNSSLIFDRSDTYSYGSGSNGIISSNNAVAISGTGSVMQMGGGTLILAGANTYSGGTTISAGTLEVEGTLGTGGVTDNATLVFNPATNMTTGLTLGGNTETIGGLLLSNNISGAGTVTQNGNGTTVLSGGNTYTGETSILDGTLEFSQTTAMSANSEVSVGKTGTLAVAVGTGTGQFTNGTSGNGTIGGLLAGVGGQVGSTVMWSAGATLGLDTTNATGTFSYGAAIADTSAGVLSFTKLGTGTLTLAGNNTYSGSTMVSGGTLILSGNNAYAAGTTISAATLEVSADNNLGATSGGITLSGGGELLTNASGFNTSRTTTITDTGTLAAVTGTTATDAGTISGAALTIGDPAHTGTVVLDGNNSYTGGTTISAGTLEISADDNLGAAPTSGSPSQGSITLSGGGELLSSVDGFTTSRAIDVTNTGVIAAVSGATATYSGSVYGSLTVGDGTNSGVITFSSTATVNGSSSSAASLTLAPNASVTSSGVISGLSISDGNANSGMAVTVGTGASLTNNGTISGGSTVGGGTGGAFGGNGGDAVTLTAGASLTNNRTISGGNGGTGGNAVGLGGSNGDGGNGGNGGVGVNVTAATTFVNNGTISGGNGGNGGDSQVYDGGFGGIGGNGGAGVVLASGASIVNSGLITGGSGGGGGYNDTQYGDFYADGGAGGGGITASGNATVINSGSIASVDFSGGSNTLELDSTSQIGGYVISTSGTTNGGDTLALGGATNGTFNVSNIGPSDQYLGFANFAKNGSSTWTLTGTATMSGPWTINAGTLAVATGGSIASASSVDLANSGATFDISGAGNQTIQDLSGVSGSIVNLGANTLTAGTADSTEFDGNIEGTGGSLIKQNSGTLTLTGSNTYSGGTMINNGTLATDGSSALGAGNVTLNSGGELSVNSALTVGGNFTQTGGTLLVTVNSPLQNGRYNLLNVTGTATLGGTLKIDAANYTAGETFTVVLNANSMNGNFASIASAEPSLLIIAKSLSSDHQSLTLTLATVSTLTFSQWEGLYGINSAATATPENDGVPNLLKYLSNINPTLPTSAVDRAALSTLGMDTTTTPGTEYLTLTYRQAPYLEGTTINVQTSPDLQTWTTVTPDLSQQIGTDPSTADPIMEVGIIVNGSSRQFIRLNVTQP